MKRGGYSAIVKPALDRLGALVLLACSGWLLLIICLVFLASGNYPVFFYAQRMGRNQAPFRMIKFRTLHTDQARPVSMRRSGWGDFLRLTNFDELPQLWNVLRGEMSIIGPRPLPVEYGRLMDANQHLRHTVKPGITGWAQVNGRHAISWEEKFELDRWYIQNISFTTDLKIIIKTIILLLSLKEDRSLAEKEFTGQ